jgi:hypothetical protein
MAKNVYHNGKLIPAKDWDFDLKKPKVKQPKKQEIIVEVAEEQIQD